MATTDPIKDVGKIHEMKAYFLERDEARNYALFMTGIHSALRIGDILRLKWKDVYDENRANFRFYLELTEQKTKKTARIALHEDVLAALRLYRLQAPETGANTYIFASKKGINQPISRVQAYRIIKKAADAACAAGNIACHSLRKTFGYQAYKQGTPPPLIMQIYNHSSYEVTKRYLCITQDEKDAVYLSLYF